MTFIELIVVLSIFSIMSGIVLSNYKDFQLMIGVKILANDVALKIVEAQKLAMSGKLAPLAQQTFQGSFVDLWKPSYGVYFDSSASPDFDGVSYNKKFIYFADLDNGAINSQVSYFYPHQVCGGSSNMECLDSININKGFYVSQLSVECNGGTMPALVTNLSITFTRPDSGAVIQSSNPSCTPTVAIIEFKSSVISTAKATVVVYASGRVQIR